MISRDFSSFDCVLSFWRKTETLKNKLCHSSADSANKPTSLLSKSWASLIGTETFLSFKIIEAEKNPIDSDICWRQDFYKNVVSGLDKEIGIKYSFPVLG